MLRKSMSISVALLLVIALLLAGFGALAVASEESGEGMPVPKDPSFHREFGIFYDEASGDVYISDSRFNRIVKTKMDGSGWATLGTLGTVSDGSTRLQSVTVGAHSRLTVSVNAFVPEGQDVSLAIDSSRPIVVERPIYFNFNGNTTGGSDTMGFSE